jgi:hypothetical protein
MEKTLAPVRLLLTQLSNNYGGTLRSKLHGLVIGDLKPGNEDLVRTWTRPGCITWQWEPSHCHVALIHGTMPGRGEPRLKPTGGSWPKTTRE